MNTAANNLVILDRDGVINEDSDAYVKSASEWIPIPGSVEAIAELSKAGFTLIVATNQSGLARGYFSEAELTAMHAKMLALVEQAGGKIEGIYHCPHGPDDQCDCRKPKPGMLQQIAADLSLDIAGSYIIGDSKRDLQAGIAMGCHPILVKTGKGQRTLEQAGLNIPNLIVCADLAQAAQHILNVSRET